MGKLSIEANVRLRGTTDKFPKESFEKIINEEFGGNVKNYEKVAKQDLVRAIISDLGFDEDGINVTKFKVEYIDDVEVENE